MIQSETVAVISTAHLTEQEAERLTDLFNTSDDPIGMVRDEGWLLLCDQVITALPRINYILGFLSARGFSWVLFDADADRSEEFDSFDW